MSKVTRKAVKEFVKTREVMDVREFIRVFNDFSIANTTHLPLVGLRRRDFSKPLCVYLDRYNLSVFYVKLDDSYTVNDVKLIAEKSTSNVVIDDSTYYCVSISDEIVARFNDDLQLIHESKFSKLSLDFVEELERYNPSITNVIQTGAVYDIRISLLRKDPGIYDYVNLIIKQLYDDNYVAIPVGEEIIPRLSDSHFIDYYL